jgi:DNA-binding response OmpR family regulator
VIVLDIGLPFCSGYDITLTLRAQNKTVPILMLTARDAEDDIIRGFDLGADDYLIKPFSFPELLARLNALARPTYARTLNGRLVFDPARLTVLHNNTAVQLTRTEFSLLFLLAEDVGRPVTRQRLMEAVWGIEAVHSNTLDVFINALRGKLNAPFQSRMIQTIRGLGYRLQVDGENDDFEYQELAG